MCSADKYGCRILSAVNQSPQGSSWDYARERQSLAATMNELAARTKKAVDAQLKAAQSQSTALQFLQGQQQQIAAMQSQMYGSASPWNLVSLMDQSQYCTAIYRTI